MLPIRYPEHLPIEKFSGRMHDLNEPLRNPKPYADWALGDVAWCYDSDKKMLVAGPITYLAGGCAVVHDMRPRPGDADTIAKMFDQLFRDEAELMAAMLAPPDEGGKDEVP